MRVQSLMSLQYRTRDISDDRSWNQRVRIAEFLLMDVVEQWLRDDHAFPVDLSVASLLFIFSPRCDPFDLPDLNVKQRLFAQVDSPVVEYTLTWPDQREQIRSCLIAALTAILEQAIDRWNTGPVEVPAVSEITQLIADTIVENQYVIFHRYQTTQRDHGGFHGVW